MHMSSLAALLVLVFLVFTGWPGIAATVAAQTAAREQQVVHCSNIEELISAFFNQDVTTVLVYGSLSMTESDWVLRAAPAVVGRNLNISGVDDDMSRWPIIDLGFVQSKVQVEEGKTLSFTRVVLRRWRRGPHFQAPGLDLIATGREPAERSLASAWAHVRFYNMGWIHRSCLAPSLGRLISNTTKRPAFVPGQQQVILNVPQTGCISGDDGAPVLQRCWPLAFIYDSFVTYGYNMRGYDVLPAGYVLWLQNSVVRCEVVLDESCVHQWGSPLGCFYMLFPNEDVAVVTGDVSGGGAGSSSSSSNPSSGDETLGTVLPVSGGFGGGGDGPQPSLLGPLLGGCVGGATTSLAVSCLLALRMSRKRRRRPGSGSGTAAACEAARHFVEGSEEEEEHTSGAAAATKSGGRGRAPTAPLLHYLSRRFTHRGGGGAGWSLRGLHGLQPGAPEAGDAAEGRDGAAPLPLRLPSPPMGLAGFPYDDKARADACAPKPNPGGGYWGGFVAAAMVGSADVRRLGLPHQGWKAREGSDRAGAAAAAAAGVAAAAARRAEGISASGEAQAVRMPGNGVLDASSAAPVTPQTPLKPDVNLALRLDSGGGELVLLPGVIGKGTFGRVVSGRYGGQPVAVKLLDYGLLQAGRAGGAGRAGRAGGQAAVAAAAVAGAAAAPETSTAIRCLSLSMGSAAAAAAAVTAPASGTAAVAAADSAPAADIAAVVVTAEAAASVDVGTLPSFDIRSLAERCARVPEYLLRLAHPAGVDSTFSGIRVDGSGGGVSGHGPAAVASAVTVPTAAEVKAAVTEAEAAAHVAGDAVSERTAPDVLFFRMQAHGFGAAKPTGLREFMERHCGGGVAGDNGGGGGGGGILLGGDLLLNEVDSGQDSGSEGVSLEGPWVKGAEAAGAPTVKAVPDADAKAAVAAAAVARDGSRPRDIRQRTLIQEMEVLARVRHPNIVRLLAACTQPPHMCLVMELMETSLDRLLYGSGPVAPLMPLDKVLHIALQMASALEYLHPTIMHRDLKPANVLLQNAASPTPVVKLADFGLSRLQTSVLVTENVDVGTVPYMAPETLNVKNCVVTHHVDIYALGIILWELLAGLRPWAGLEIVQIAVAVEMRRQRPPLDVLPVQRCPRKLRTLIQRCWEHVPERRPAAAEVVKELLLVRMQLEMGSTDNCQAALTTSSYGHSVSMRKSGAAAFPRVNGVSYNSAVAAAAAAVAAGGAAVSGRCLLGELGELGALEVGLDGPAGHWPASPAVLRE